MPWKPWLGPAGPGFLQELSPYFRFDVGARRENIESLMHSTHFPAWLGALIPLLVLLALWDAVWKTLGMWKSARNNQLAWFICIAIFSTVGILPILYLSFFQKDKNSK